MLSQESDGEQGRRLSVCVYVCVDEWWSEVVRGTVASSSPEGERVNDGLSAAA